MKTSTIKQINKVRKQMAIEMLGWMCLLFGASSLINSFPFELIDLPLPLIFFIGGFGLLKYYQKLSPPPEFPLNKSFL